VNVSSAYPTPNARNTALNDSIVEETASHGQRVSNDDFSSKANQFGNKMTPGAGDTDGIAETFAATPGADQDDNRI